MTSSAKQIRSYDGPALFSYGFRPFFLVGAAWSALAMALWLPMLAGHAVLPTAMAPLDWHVHEMVFGFVPAVVAGFLLTAVPNWTGRLPVVGAPLVGLFGVWVAGRVAIAGSAVLTPPVAAVIDLSFLATLALVIAREIVAGGNYNNLKVLVAVIALWLGNLLFHMEGQELTPVGLGQRLGIATAIAFIMLVGGRIIPSFTRNWLVRQEPGRLPIPFGRFDIAAMAASLVSLTLWVSAIEHPAAAAAAGLAAVINAIRLARWAGERTVNEPLVLVLHAAFAFVPVGFALLTVSLLLPGLVPSSAVVHTWTGGAIGLMTLAVMTRTSLGHTGRPLVATTAICSLYLAIVLSALCRIAAALGIATDSLLTFAAIAWVVGFSGFVIVYAPILLVRRS